MDATLNLNPAVLELNQKLDKLATQVEFLTEEAHRQKRRQQEWDELKHDLMPLSHEMYGLAVRELEDIQGHVQLEDLLHLFKRLLIGIGTCHCPHQVNPIAKHNGLKMMKL